MLIFDIETGPQPDSCLIKTMPNIDLSKFDIGDFDPGAVKYGNTTDKDKRAAKLKSEQDKHAAAMRSSSSAKEAATEEAWRAHCSKAALHPENARVLAIFYYSVTKKGHVCSGAGGESEADILSDFWACFETMRSAERSMVGHNIFDFDLTMILNRSRILKLNVPTTAFSGAQMYKHYVNWSPTFQCTRRYWLAGRHFASCKSDFNTLANAFGTAGKPEGISGADFHKMWNGTPEERAEAIAYGQSDVEQPAVWAPLLGII